MSYDVASGSGYYPDWVPSNDSFGMHCSLGVYEENATQVHYYVWSAMYLQPAASFGGTIINYGGTGRSNGSVAVYGSGWYADSGVIDMGWVNRGTTVTNDCWCGYTSASGAYRGASASCSYTFPTRTPHGNPTITGGKPSVTYGESLTLTAHKATEQGNAAFYAFAWFVNGVNKGGAETLTLTPSDITGAAGGTVTVDLVEAHSWYGSMFETQATLTIEVVAGVLTVYDDSGAKRTGLVTAYDADGNARSVLITAYDESGSARSTQ